MADGEIDYNLWSLLAEARLRQWSGELLKQSVIDRFRKIIPAMHEDSDHLAAEAAIPALYPMLSVPERTPGLHLFE